MLLRSFFLSGSKISTVQAERGDGMDQAGVTGVPSFSGGGVAASPPFSHPAFPVILQDLELLNTSEETPWRSRALGTSPGSVLDEAREHDVAFQGPLCVWVGGTGAMAGHIALLPLHSQQIQEFLPTISLPHL